MTSSWMCQVLLHLFNFCYCGKIFWQFWMLIIWKWICWESEHDQIWSERDQREQSVIRAWSSMINVHSILVSCVGSEPTRLFLSLFWLESKINKNSQKSKSTISNLIKLYFSGNTLHTEEKSKTNQNFAFFSKKVNKISDTNL